MGDRVNIAVQADGKRVYFYGHWSGYPAPWLVQEALKRRERWNDPPYLARIVFCHFMDGDYNRTTGFGISTSLGDNEYPLIVVDCDAQQVRFEDADGAYQFQHVIGKAFSFEDYCNLKFDRYDSLWEAIESSFH